ncbi:MAG: tryptophan 2,3-dioxygenase [Flavobacteriaceae bacterium]|nr:tryptophan 2,3-dioxygenase [Flavobacteriaceae bacterium]
MDNLDPKIISLLEKLEQKYAASGQDMVSYLEGLLYNDYVKYWDYIELETLLSLQKPRTNIPDENIFIIYHQITELYFKLSLAEIEQLATYPSLDAAFFTERVGRINRYFQSLTQSFAIMVDGMEPQQFLKYRMSLLPASGFQSVQYRMIEIGCTDFINLVAKDKREGFKEDSSIIEMFDHIYWKEGAIIMANGKKTLTLEMFEQKYSEKLVWLSLDKRGCNLWQLYDKLKAKNGGNAKLEEALRNLDANININWPLVHYRSAVRYLQRDPEDIGATGGTNWQKYLPPRFQKRIFYPQLWSEQEMADWGKSWVDTHLGKG